MGWSIFKDIFIKRVVRVTIILKNGLIIQKTLSYDKYSIMYHKNHAYWVDPACMFKFKNKSYMFYMEDNPYPMTFNFDDYKPTIMSGTFSEAMRTKFLDEVTRAPNQVLIILIIVVLNLVLSIVIIAKLWGVFERA
jgi:hypothetical protein